MVHEANKQESKRVSETTYNQCKSQISWHWPVYECGSKSITVYWMKTIFGANVCRTSYKVQATVHAYLYAIYFVVS